MRRLDSWRTTTARRLRREATDAEHRIWLHLKGSREQHWRRQSYLLGCFLDFYSSRARLAVELDGGQHFETRGAELDRAREARLARRGIQVLRFDDALALTETEAVVEEIQRVWRERMIGR